MTAKQLLFGREAHARLLKGMNLLADPGLTQVEPARRAVRFHDPNSGRAT